LPWTDPDHILYKVAVLCGNPRTKHQLNPFFKAFSNNTPTSQQRQTRNP